MLHMNLGENSYDIHIGRGLIDQAGKLMNLNRRVLVVTDDGVPEDYALRVAAQCKSPVIVTLAQGEQSKSVDGWQRLLTAMLENSFTRGDCCVAVGGGMAGDLTGFAASAYMRGIDFYNIPTTTLSQVDSSIGGKTAINFGGIKNIVGAFWQPKAVIVDPDLPLTQDNRQYASGLAEAVKMGMTSDNVLFEMFETADIAESIEAIITRALQIKKDVVEQDEKEQGLRKILNLGHTIGHGYEAQGLGLYHGECVALGMIPMCEGSVRERLLRVLERLGLPTHCDVDADKVFDAMLHDKKFRNGKVTVITVPEIGSWQARDITTEELRSILEAAQ